MSRRSRDFRFHSTRRNTGASVASGNLLATRDVGCFSTRGNWSVGHMRRLSCARRKVATAGCEGGGVMRGDSGGGGGGVFPHYKFNLTNGSENLETMEYMKCGRVYHAGGGGGGGGVVATAILSGPIHILRKRDGERTARARGAESGSRPGCRRTAKHASGTTRSPRARR